MLASLLGATTAAALLSAVATLGLRPPVQALGVVAAIGALAEAANASRILPSSPWRIPKRWCGGGIAQTAAIFGWFLGFGFPVAISSAGIYAVWMWPLARPGVNVWPVFLAYGFGRALPLLHIWHIREKGDVVMSSDAIARALNLLRTSECLLLATLATATL